MYDPPLTNPGFKPATFWSPAQYSNALFGLISPNFLWVAGFQEGRKKKTKTGIFIRRG
jgi:hypothetical protein